ncbi:hypothetical protein [Paenarthrobacter sp. C1]|uniref:hypothetical protein n=1 Tax=Paenarthrobacter sp. C1 TaxID=3400220 RepID=UPI003BF58C5A
MGVLTWSDDQLREAVRSATSYSGVLRNLGLRGKETKSLKRHITRLELSTEHFKPVRSYSDEQLKEAVAASLTVSEVLRRLGMTPRGGSHAHVSKRIQRMGLDNSHFVGSQRGPVDGVSWNRKTPADILVRKPAGSPRTATSQLKRALLESGEPHECAECGTGPVWQGRPLTLQVEHKDGDAANCLRENLCFLCPNCHTQTPTYARKKNPG